MSDEKAKARPAATAGAASRSSVAASSRATSGGAGGKELAKRDDAEGEDGKRPGPLRWVLGWIVLPGSVVGAIFGAGALVGAHFHDSWFTRAIVWVGELF
jgi:hypothetical protein